MRLGTLRVLTIDGFSTEPLKIDDLAPYSEWNSVYLHCYVERTVQRATRICYCKRYNPRALRRYTQYNNQPKSRVASRIHSNRRALTPW